MAETQEFLEKQEINIAHDFLEKIKNGVFNRQPTGLEWFDDLLMGGIPKQSLLLLLAPPATGKTTLAMELAETLAEHGKPVLYFSLEMSRYQMLSKAISRKLADFDLSSMDILEYRERSKKEQQVIETALNEYAETTAKYLRYIDDSGNSLDQIEKILKEQPKEKGAFVFVDYLHLISSGNNDQAETLKKAVLMLKNYAEEHNTIAFAISAVNRSSNGKIMLASSRDSSNVEYTGDIALSLNYEELDNMSEADYKKWTAKKQADLEQKEERELIIRVLKSRFGETGRSQSLGYKAKVNKFEPRKGRKRTANYRDDI